MWHALEHVEDPANIFLQIREWMKEGGVLVVEVPNVEAVCQAPGHRFHRAHLYNFNPATLAGLGTKSGFSVEEVTLSEDGGNVTAIFRKTQSESKAAGVPPSSFAEAPEDKPAGLTPPGAQTDWQTDWGTPGPDNARRIQETIRRHTPLRHYFSHYPYTRPLQRFRNFLNEQWFVIGLISGSEGLEKQFSCIENDS